MAPDLPADVLELLFDEFQDESGGNAIGLCGLVCRAWLPPSRSRLFATVVLKERSAQSFVDVARTSSLPIKNFILTLRLILRARSTFFQDDSSIEHLGPFPEATTLFIDADIRKWIPEMAGTFFPNNFPRLTNLNLSLSDYTAISMFDILVAVTPFPTLESLRLDINGHGLDFMDDSMPEVYQIPPRLRTLHLGMAMTENFWEILYELAENDGIDIPVLSTLSVQDGWPKGRSFLGRYLWGYGHNMQHLCFDCSSGNMFEAPEALSCCTALRRLDLRITTSKVPGTLISIAEHLASPVLAEINVVGPHKRTGKSLSREVAKWKELDQALSEERFAGLRSLSFTLSQKFTELLHESMPLCAARGILRIVKA
ncbi:hypothetical protein FB451DRAFT_1263742 [Mycena latifolia]|nr:hypothetical protein FB451DRAFT_1263742 [Mycena latifolia]